MILHRPHLIQETAFVSDGMGGKVPDGHADKEVVYGVLDLLSGSDRSSTDNSLTENSTHVLVILDYVPDITDNMRVVDADFRVYDITYSDNPAGQNHHNELLLTLVPGQTHKWSVPYG